MRHICLKNKSPLAHFLAMLHFYTRGGSRTAAPSKVELFVIIVNGSKPLTIITKTSTLDVAAVLDSPLYTPSKRIFKIEYFCR